MVLYRVILLDWYSRAEMLRRIPKAITALRRGDREEPDVWVWQGREALLEFINNFQISRIQLRKK